MQLLTVVSEPLLLEALRTDFTKLGGTGVTISEVSGEGSRKSSSGEIPREKIKIECVASPQIVEKILEHIANEYFQDYSVIAYATDVMVIRTEKFEGKKS